ncbi:MAG: ABC transporter ATP-binding protein [Steroidobacteraceae bacterium]
MTERVLEVTGLHAKHGRHPVLRGVDLHVAKGEWFCLLGPNGVGKSTLLNCITGRMRVDTGQVSVCGHSMLAQPVEAKRWLGTACAPEQLPGLLTGRQCLELYAAAKGLASIDIELTQIAAQLCFTPFMDRCVDTYSLGTRQKLAVLLALLGDPALIVLDEAFNGLDPASAMTLKRLLRVRLSDLRCAVLLATHSLDIVEHHADTAALMLDGRVARQWNHTEIAGLRSLGNDGIEAALAAAAGSMSR